MQTFQFCMRPSIIIQIQQVNKQKMLKQRLISLSISTITKRNLLFGPSLNPHSSLCLLYLLILAFLAPNASACSYYNQSDPSFSCRYCGRNCVITSNNQTYGFKGFQICITCCYDDLYPNVTKQKQCTQQNMDQGVILGPPSVTSSNTATILIIIFFSIPAVVCIIIIIMTAIKNRQRERQRNGRQNPLPPLDLNDYKLDDIAPIYIDGQGSCSICLQEKCNVITSCRHAYHAHCLKNWIRKRQNCPECRKHQFNPIAVYCSKCSKSVKLTFLIEQMAPQHIAQWQRYRDLLCNSCLQNKNEISIDFTIVSQRKHESNLEIKKNPEIECNETKKTLNITPI